MDDQRTKDQHVKLVPSKETGKSNVPVTLDVIKSAFITGMDVETISKQYFLSIQAVNKIVEDHKLVELRKSYIREGLSRIQSSQLDQAKKLLELEFNFKRLRILQLEKKLEDFLAYFARHGDFAKRHPVSGEVLKDTDGIPMQLNVPSVTREISQLKESVTLSEGMKRLLVQVDDVINGKTKNEDEVVDIENVDSYFVKSE